MFKASNRIAYIGFSAVSIVLIALYIHYQMQAPLTTKAPLSNQVLLTEVNASFYDESGKLEKQLEAPHLKHNLENKQNIILNPTIHFIKDNQPWTITADKAISKGMNEEVLLVGHVIINQYQKKTLISQLKTNRLLYFPKTQKVKTKAKIFYHTKGITVTSIGMHADLKHETIDLLSKTRGRYEPTVS